ncbi:TonB-dependent receptor [Erwinia sp. INIA-01]|uniref:TonB-dependent receptor n=1 Tax=Erwinia sp. INIA01 TaxID=2991500 RepID=UPI00222402DE|nr:TonB-dependent receptor [Erwinia sp. INIA01]MCW1875055.1 TonB-dependent receptor [Erwinia sp. INIA01]
MSKASSVNAPVCAGMAVYQKRFPLAKISLIQAGILALLAQSALATAADKTTTAQTDASVRQDQTLLVTATASATDKIAQPEPYPGGQVASGGQLGMLGNKDLLDTPFSQTSYTAQQIENTPAPTVMQLIADLNPSARAEWSSLGSSASQINVRGFNVQSQDVGFNGLYGMLPISSISPDIADRIEFLEGPSAFLNGMPPGGSVGGAVNIVPKRATDAPITRLTTTYTSKSQVGAKVDIGRRFGDENQFGVRFNGAWSEGNTPVDNNKKHLGLASIGLDYRGDRARVSLDAGYQDTLTRGVVPYFYIPSGITIPQAPKSTNNISPSWTRFGNKDTFGALRGEYDMTDNVTVHAAVGGDINHQSDIEIGQPMLLNDSGDISTTPWISPGKTKTGSAEVGIAAKFTTGPVDHQINAQATTLHRTVWGGGATVGDEVTNNIYNPNWTDEPDFPTPSLPKQSTARLSGLALGDTLSILDDRVQLTAGGRLQRVEQSDYDTTNGGISDSYSKNALSPSVALLVKPWQNISLYTSYIQGLRQGSTVGTGYANAGHVFAPYKTKQVEAGVKADWGYFGTTLSVYQLTQPSTTTDSTTNTVNENGEQRNRGVSLQTFGEPVDGLRLLGGVSYINAVLTKTQDGANDGKTASGTPKWQGNTGVEWDLPWLQGLTLTGRAIYTGKQFFDTDTPRRTLPSWTRFDAGLRYLLTGVMAKPVTLRMDVVNLANRNYWASACCDSYVMSGEPRTVTLSATVDF